MSHGNGSSMEIVEMMDVAIQTDDDPNAIPIFKIEYGPTNSNTSFISNSSILRQMKEEEHKLNECNRISR